MSTEKETTPRPLEQKEYDFLIGNKIITDHETEEELKKILRERGLLLETVSK